MVFSQFIKLKESLEFQSIFDSNRFEYTRFLENLEKFDKYWASYEQFFIFELMLVENDAKRLIFESIKICEELNQLYPISNAKYESKQ